ETIAGIRRAVSDPVDVFDGPGRRERLRRDVKLQDLETASVGDWRVALAEESKALPTHEETPGKGGGLAVDSGRAERGSGGEVVNRENAARDVCEPLAMIGKKGRRRAREGEEAPNG